MQRIKSSFFVKCSSQGRLGRHKGDSLLAKTRQERPRSKGNYSSEGEGIKRIHRKIANSKKDTLEDLNNGDDIDICLDLDAGGGRVVAEFGILSEKSETLKIHPILIYQGTDVRQNLEICLGGLTEQIRNLEKSIVKINGKSLKIKLYGLFDLCALNTVVGKQNHSSTYFCAWTSCKLEHIRNHKNVAHTESTCKEIMFLTISLGWMF